MRLASRLCNLEAFFQMRVGLHNLKATLKSRLPDYIIQNTIFLKYILDYIIRKLFSNLRLTSRLCNLEYEVTQKE